MASLSPLCTVAEQAGRPVPLPGKLGALSSFLAGTWLTPAHTRRVPPPFSQTLVARQKNPHIRVSHTFSRNAWSYVYEMYTFTYIVCPVSDQGTHKQQTLP